MKHLIFLLLLICSPLSRILLQTSSTTKLVKICGQLQNYDANLLPNTIKAGVNDPGTSSQLSYKADIQPDGTFCLEFERYHPQDVWIVYQTTFLIFVRPGDSLYMQWDGHLEKRVDIHKTLEFSGDAANLNHQLSNYLSEYFSIREKTLPLLKEAQKNSKPDEYLTIVKNYKKEIDLNLQAFIEKHNPSSLIRTWTKMEVEMEYYLQSSMYPIMHRMLNNYKSSEWSIPLSFFEKIKPLPILDTNLIINTKASRKLANQYLYVYVFEIIKQAKHANYGEARDSIILSEIIHQTKGNPLLKQMVLTEFVNTNLRRNKVEEVEKYWGPIIRKHVTVPFLFLPLEAHLERTLHHLNAPKISSETILDIVNQTEAEDIIKNILKENAGKVIYLDVWATWCSPCIAEMPNSQEMQNQFKNEEVSFVFICIDSEEKAWKGVLSRFQLAGQHLLLAKTQGEAFQETLEVKGIPHYFLIDKNGKIIEKGSHLRPGKEATMKKIKALLKE